MPIIIGKFKETDEKSKINNMDKKHIFAIIHHNLI